VRPSYDDHKAAPWEQYAFDATGKPRIGRQSREWTAIGPTQGKCLRNMASAPREIGESRVPQW